MYCKLKIVYVCMCVCVCVVEIERERERKKVIQERANHWPPFSFSGHKHIDCMTDTEPELFAMTIIEESPSKCFTAV